MPTDWRIALMGQQPSFSLAPFGQGVEMASGLLSLREKQRQYAEAEAIRQAYAQQLPSAGLYSGLAPQMGVPPPETFPSLAEQEAASTHMALYGSLPEGYSVAGAAPAAGTGAGQAPLRQAPQGLAGVRPQQPGLVAGGLASPVRPSRQDPLVRSLYTISPQAARVEEDRLYNDQKQRFEANLHRVEYLSRVADTILEADTQQAYDVGRRMLIAQGMPEGEIPPIYDKGYVQQLSGMGKDSADRLRLASARLAEARAQSERGKAPDYGYGEGVNAILYSRYGDQIAPGSRPTPTMVQQARAEYLRTDPQSRLHGARARREEYEAEAVRGVQEEMGGGTAAAPARRMSEADIGDAMRQTGRSRSEVLTAARAKGFTVEGETTTQAAPLPSVAPSVTPSAAPGAAPGRSPTAASADAPPSARPLAPAPVAPAPAAGGADETRLRTLERLRDDQEKHLAQVKRKWGTSEAGKTAVSQAEAELSRRNTEIARLTDRIYERGGGKAAQEAEQARLTTRARAEEERAARRSQTTAETLGKEAPNLYDVQTAQPVNPSQPYGEVLQAQQAGTVRQLPQRQAERLQVAREAVPVLERMQRYVDVIYGPGGELEGASRNDLQQLIAGTLPEGQMQRYFPTLVEAARFVESNASTLARGLKGEVGAMTEGDIERAMAGLPHFRSLFSLGLGFGGGYVPGRGIGPSVTVKPQFRMADTERTARNVLQDTVDIVNRTTAQILGRQDFQYEELRRGLTP